MLVWKVFCHLLDEILSAIGKLVFLASQGYHIITGRIQLGKLHIPVYLQIAHQFGQSLTFCSTSDKVHSGFKLCPMAIEALQATAYLLRLLQQRNVITILG